MFRYRRYRVFLVFAFVAVFALYKFGNSTTSWREAASNAAGLRHGAENAPQKDTKSRPVVAYETSSLKLNVPVASNSQPLQTPPPPAKPPLRPSTSPAMTAKEQTPTIPTPGPPRPHANPNKLDSDPSSLSSIEAVHWSKLPEHFPVASKSLIKLPSGKSKPIPKIQFAFKPEDASTRADRISKLDTIRNVFKKSWNGYRNNAWLHDELRPQSGNFKDPFAGWGATLVDALDTLWIMGMKTEFEEAAKAVDQIDFTTSDSPDIRVFETTIRYVGGLLAAYDISGKKYKNLLNKAVELAEILMSAFDTPNRMPELYYYWRPLFASQPHRASTRVVLAEIGSLSMEFTRLAQLTGEHKYYDAIARITDNLEAFQNNTKLPGMWPTKLDASGCGKIPLDVPLQEPLRAPESPSDDSSTDKADHSSPEEPLSPEGKKYIPLDLPDPVIIANDDSPKIEDHVAATSPGKDKVRNWKGDSLEKRQLDVDHSDPPKVVLDTNEASDADLELPKPPECVPQGFVSSDWGREEFTLGGESDSTYEYLPKQYLLLGGQVEKYRTMYEKSVDVVKKHLIFRPMLPNEDDILFSGKLYVPAMTNSKKIGDLEGENAHLTCFAGGMIGMSAKLFDRPEDLEIAKKLTEGCVWSYNMTATGIMPESFETLPCESTKHCPWNETAYWESLDPLSEYRVSNYKEQLQEYEKQLASASAWYDEQLAAITAPPTPAVAPVFEAEATQPPVHADTLDKRQLADLEEDEPVPAPKPGKPKKVQVMSIGSEEDDDSPSEIEPSPVIEETPQPSLTLPAFPMLYSPNTPVSHKEYVQNRIKEERLPQGVTKIGGRNYILRPEAIESVWYMHRITGDPHWREVGWRMFLAINQHTSTVYGNSAIDDVTMTHPQPDDSMESFWLAETLKYFYLLFAEESVVSLDEWVLNTEAHPFRRPT